MKDGQWTAIIMDGDSLKEKKGILWCSYNTGPFYFKVELLFLKVNLLSQDSGPSLCEGSLSEPTKPPGYGPALGG